MNNTHEYFPNDSMYMGFVDFQEALENITYPNVKSHVFQHEKEIKETTLYIRRSKFEAEDKLDRKNMEREARQ